MIRIRQSAVSRTFLQAQSTRQSSTIELKFRVNKLSDLYQLDVSAKFTGYALRVLAHRDWMKCSHGLASCS